MISEKMRIAYIGVVIAIIFFVLATRPANPKIVVFAYRPTVATEKSHCEAFSAELDALSKTAGKAQYFVATEVGEDIVVRTANGLVGLAGGAAKVLGKADVIVAASPETVEMILSHDLGYRAIWIASAQESNLEKWREVAIRIGARAWLDGNLIPLESIPSMLKENGVPFAGMALLNPGGGLQPPKDWLAVSDSPPPPGTAVVVSGDESKVPLALGPDSFFVGLSPQGPAPCSYRVFKAAAKIEALMTRKYLDNEYRAPEFKVPLITAFVKQNTTGKADR